MITKVQQKCHKIYNMVPIMDDSKFMNLKASVKVSFEYMEYLF